MAKSENPILADLIEADENSSIIASNKNSPVEDIAKAIQVLLDEYPDKNTKITSENEEGLIAIDVIQAHMMKSFKGYKFPALIALKESKQDHALSVDGFRFDKIVEIFKSIQTNIISGDSASLKNRLLGR
jgi:hypothetical protein